MTFKVAGGAGVAVYEMPVTGEVREGALVAFAEEAMRDAAGAITDSFAMRGLSAQFHGAVAGETLRAEAIVMGRRGESVHVAADILAGGLRVASFEADTWVAA